MATKLASTDGRRWAFMQVFRVVDLDDPSRTYLTRLRIAQTPLFGVYLHRIGLDDGTRPLHDHPWSFLAIILCGGYVEETLRDGSRTWRAGSMHWMPYRTFHSVRELHRSPTWTLILVGRRRGDWGFLADGQWVPHKEYIRSALQHLRVG